MRSCFYLVLSFFLVLLLNSKGYECAALGKYNIDIRQTSVSGLSSGGYMAVQMNVAFSSIMKGAGVFAGGPYNCAKGAIGTATSTCMSGSPVASTYIATTDSRASAGSIDPLSSLKTQKVYLFSGTKDTTVVPAVMNALNTYYQHYTSTVQYVNTMTAAHTQPTDNPANKNACTLSSTPYISNCAYDGAGQALQYIYGPLNARSDFNGLKGTIYSFDQTQFISTGKGMASTGYVFVPKSCESGDTCKLHISFHGCLQSYDSVGNAYVERAGFNYWADTNNMVVLYPQTVSSFISPSNPNGCWDWWGYNGDTTTYDTKTGYQMVALKKMIDHLASNFVNIDPPTGLNVTGSTDDSISLIWKSVNQNEVAGYSVYRNNRKVSNMNGDKNVTFTDTELASGSTYNYYVTTITTSGAESKPSSTVQGTTTGTPPPLPAPSGLSVVSKTSSTVSLSWDAVEGATDYNVYRNDVRIDHAVLLEPKYTDTNLQSETVYTYTVTALNMLGKESPFSSPIKVTTNSAWVCKSYTDSNYNQVAAGRAYMSGGYAYALGSAQLMGLYNTFYTSTLSETRQGYFIVGPCAGKDNVVN